MNKKANKRPKDKSAIAVMLFLKNFLREANARARLRLQRYDPEGEQLVKILIPLRINPVLEKRKQGSAKV